MIGLRSFYTKLMIVALQDLVGLATDTPDNKRICKLHRRRRLRNSSLEFFDKDNEMFCLACDALSLERGVLIKISRQDKSEITRVINYLKEVM